MNQATDQAIDKSTWGPGPWQTEPDRLEWRYKGMPCLIVRGTNHGALCGYVGLPPGHRYHGAGYEDVAADAHGGLTYSAKCAGHICHVPAPGEPDDVWWLGFDCAHSGDRVPAMDALRHAVSRRPGFGLFGMDDMGGGDEYRDLAYVKAEVERLADQLAAVTQ